MFSKPQIAPSILSADFMRLGEQVKMIDEAGADLIHVDIMDGHFVPNLTIGPAHVKALKQITDVPLDVHLMVSNPEEQVDWYIDAGADIITFHYEATPNPIEVVRKIRKAGRMAGIAISPDTNPYDPMGILQVVQVFLVMSVYPGFGGQKFIESTPERLDKVVEMCGGRMCAPYIEVDGGINTETAALCVKHGADYIVAGNSIFGAPDPAKALKDIRDACN